MVDVRRRCLWRPRRENAEEPKEPFVFPWRFFFARFVKTVNQTDQTTGWFCGLPGRSRPNQVSARPSGP